MKNTIGSAFTMTLFGESHGEAAGCVLDGLPSGIPVDMNLMKDMLEKRKPGSYGTPRREEDLPRIISGVFEGYTTGTPLTILMENTDVKRSDYDSLAGRPRPSHADYAAEERYLGYADASGGGHFSGRLTAPLCAAGAVYMTMLKEKGITLATHIRRIRDTEDRAFREDPRDDIAALSKKRFAVLDEKAGEQMQAAIASAAMEGNSLGGILETAVSGFPAGVGEPWFDALEGMLAHALFSIPACKGVSFGSGFGFADMKGSEANDPFILKDERIMTSSNHSGGINGGISNGMPIVYSCVFRPTPSIAIPQKTVDLKRMEETEITVRGRHDACIAARAAVIVDALSAFVLADALCVRFGPLWFQEKRK